MKNEDFKKIEMYECRWCQKVFRSIRHKCMFNPKNRNCFSCKHCTGFETFNGQEAEPGTGWQWEIEPYKTFLCDLEESVDEEYGDFYKLYDRNWEGNCPHYELSDNYNGKKSYAELMNRKNYEFILRKGVTHERIPN